MVIEPGVPHNASPLATADANYPVGTLRLQPGIKF